MTQSKKTKMIKTIKRPTVLDFKTKNGGTVKIKAVKIRKKPNKTFQQKMNKLISRASIIVKPPEKLTPKRKAEIRKVVKKALKDFGEVLRKLENE